LPPPAAPAGKGLLLAPPFPPPGALANDNALLAHAGSEHRRVLRALPAGGYPDKDAVAALAREGPIGNRIQGPFDIKDAYQLRTPTGGGCVTVYATATVHCAGANPGLSLQMVEHFTDQNLDPPRKRKKRA
jgi:hypothetical protein